jgi:hypothetical protein
LKTVVKTAVQEDLPCGASWGLADVVKKEDRKMRGRKIKKGDPQIARIFAD